MKPKESVTKMGFRVDALFSDLDSLANHMSGAPHQVTSITSKTHLRLTWSNERPRGHNTTGAGAALISIWLIRIIGKTEVLTIIVVGVNVELEFSCLGGVPKLVNYTKSTN